MVLAAPTAPGILLAASPLLQGMWGGWRQKRLPANGDAVPPGRIFFLPLGPSPSQQPGHCVLVQLLSSYSQCANWSGQPLSLGWAGQSAPVIASS